MLYRFLRNVLGFSNREARGSLVLLLLLLLAGGTRLAWEWTKKAPPSPPGPRPPSAQWQAWLQKQKAHEGQSCQFGAQKRLFPFDPNRVSLQQMDTLGLPRWLAVRIWKYRQAGGRFRQRNDLLRIYDFPDSLYRQLEPYIRLPQQATHSNASAAKEASRQKKPHDKHQEQALKPFELNNADTNQLMQIQGIGPAYSRRIIHFRESLGGFRDTSQLYEVYGLDSAVVRRLLRVATLTPAIAFEGQININQAGEERLQKHPYINYYQARHIVAYRRQHGPYQRLEDLLQIKTLKRTTFEKLRPYLTLGKDEEKP